MRCGQGQINHGRSVSWQLAGIVVSYYSMDGLVGEVRRYAQRYALFRSGAAVVVGVSGGPDSLCLLHVLHSLAADWNLRLHVAHLDHGLRGAEAHADARFVAAFAADLGLPCTVAAADVRALAAAGSLSLEEAARQARYRFLAETACAADADTIAVGHNADDQAETVLMHFLRGSGVAGLRGMLPKTPLAEYRLGQPADAVAGLWLVRPLLATPRRAIVAYCARHGLQPRFDQSNEDTTFFRNRLRHELLPILEQYNPAIRAVLTHTAEVLAGDYQVLRKEVQAAWAQLAVGGVPAASQSSPEEVYLDLAGWRRLPLGLQRALLREAIHRLRASLRNINWEHVERAVWLCREGTTGQKATLAAGLEAEIGYQTLRIGPERASAPASLRGVPFASEQSPAPLLAEPLPLRAPGQMASGGWRIEVAAAERAALPADLAAAGPWVACLDADAVGPEISLRPRRPGDRFQPQGMAGHSMKLNEFMINAKIPHELRAGWPLLIGAGGIAWVCGLRVAEWAAVHKTTTAVWIVRISRAP